MYYKIFKCEDARTVRMVNVKNEMRKYNDRVTIIGEDLAKANLE